MDEKATPALHEPAAIRWQCPNCRVKMQTPVRDGSFQVPVCRHEGIGKGRPSAARMGTVLYEISRDLVMLHPEPPRVHAVHEGQVWKAFAALLDAIGARMADGRLSREYCVACEDVPHYAPAGCTCPCHAAWRLREKLGPPVEEEDAA